MIRNFGYVAVGLFLILSACRKEDVGTASPLDPVSDEVLKETHPRMAFSDASLAAFNTKLGTPQWSDLVGRMNNVINTGKEEYGFGALHFAVAYQVTGEQKFADHSKEIISRIINEPGYCDVTSTYLRAPDCTGQVALAADILFDKLSDEEKNMIFDYLEVNAKGIVELKGWSGWGWQDGNPAYKQLNNYYPGHLQTILHYALLAYNHREMAREYYKLVVEEELPVALNMLSESLKGGHGAEGTWYDDKLMGHYAEVVLMLRKVTNGKVDFGKDYAKVFSDYVTWRLYAIMNIAEENGKPQLFDTPTGDQPAITLAYVIDLARVRLWSLMEVLRETEYAQTAGFVRYFEEHVNFERKGWQREFQLHYLLHFDATYSPTDFTTVLPHAWFSEGKGVAHYRTGWDENALAATIHFSPGQGQRNSHWHFGEGAFYIWYKGWQADHLNRLQGSSGVEKNTALMNTLLINGNETSQGQGDAHVLFFSGNNDYMAVKGDATENYQGLLSAFERTFLVTDRVITVYDHLVKKNPEDVINFVVNSESGFQTHVTEPGKFTTTNKAGRLTVKNMTGGNPVVTERRLRIDFDSEETQMHLLHAMEAGDGGTSSANMFLVTAQSDAGEFFGVQFIPSGQSYIHMINKTDQAASTLTYTASFGGPVKHLVTGMVPGEYEVTRNDGTVGTFNTDENGVLFFESSAGGIFHVSQ